MIPVLFALALFTRFVDQTDVFRPPGRPAESLLQIARVMRADPLEYVASDGTVLRGFELRAAKNGAPYVLLFYGNAELAQFESDRLEWLRAQGFNAVCFDYRGYGFSGGTPDGIRIRADSVALYDYVVRSLETSHSPAFVYGVSLGTQFAVHVAASRTVRGIVLQSPAASAGEEIAAYSKRFLGPASAVISLVPDASVKLIFQGAAEIAHASGPLVVVHGAQDELVPIDQGREVYAASPSRDKRFVEIPDAGHGDIRFDAAPAGPAVAEFLRNH